MKTKFIDRTKDTKHEPTKTTFHQLVDNDLKIRTTEMEPKDYKTVEYLGNDKHYGDVFIARDGAGDYFTIFFGEKGDEF